MDLAGAEQLNAASMLLRHEQWDVLQPMYNDPTVNLMFQVNREILSNTSGWLGNGYGIDLGHDLSIAPPLGYESVDIAHFDQRWPIADHALTTFVQLDAMPQYNTWINQSLQQFTNPNNHSWPSGW